MAGRIGAYLGISRAPFLALPVVLVAAGAAASAFEGAFSWARTLPALAGLLAAHVGVNSLNEASDMRTGIDLRTRRTPFSGGSGTLPSGALSTRAATIWGVGATFVAGLFGGWLIDRAGWVLAPFVAAGALCVLAYTPWLARLGIGELCAGLGLGALPVIGVSLCQDGRAGAATLAASVPAFLMTFDLLLLNEFPDAEADHAGGRRHLVIRLGRRRAARVYSAAALAVPAALAFAAATGALPAPALVAALPTLLLAPALRWAITTPEDEVPLAAQGANVVWNLSTNALLAAALLLA